MTIFIDTANVKEIKKYMAWGIVKGITTNQQIFAKEGKISYEKRIKELLRFGLPTSIELVGTNCSEQALVEEAKQLCKLGDNVIIKVPMWSSGKGMRVARLLHGEDIEVNMTCLIGLEQVILACELGVKYASFFYRRMVDYALSQDEDLSPPDAVVDTCCIFNQARGLIDEQGSPTKLIAGSIRKIEDVANALANGAHIVTVPPPIFKVLPFHQKTVDTITQFDKAWKAFHR